MPFFKKNNPREDDSFDPSKDSSLEEIKNSFKQEEAVDTQQEKGKEEKHYSSPRPRNQKKENQEPKGKNPQAVRLIPLGGLGEIGKNMMAIEYGQDIIVIDAGIMFPDSTYPGIDLLLPDFTYLKNNAHQIRALLITHGHEDHIGGVPYLLKAIPGLTVYAPRMAVELIKGKLHEHQVPYDNDKLVIAERHEKIYLCQNFSVEYVEVNHSIRDSFGLAIHTPVGVIVHTGDFKIEVDSLGDSEFDLHKFAELGSQGVLLLCSDSTNVDKKMEEKTEADVTKNLGTMIQQARGRVLISTFASNVNRVTKIVEIAERCGKKVALLGRNMENNFEIAQRLGYVLASKSTIVKHQNMKNYPDDKIVIISTGTQGETLSALTRISQDLHKIVKLKNTDTVIISASVIPGNEKAISHVLNDLSGKTDKVFYSRNASVHVSGHGCQHDLLLMLRLIKPKFFLPVHGEKRFLIQHTYLAHSVGVHPNNTMVSKNGDVLQLTQQSFKCIQQLPINNLLVENGVMGDFRNIIADRKALAESGSVFIAIGIDAMDIGRDPLIYIICKGFLMPEFEKEFIQKTRHHLEELLSKESVIDQNFGPLVLKCKKSVEFLLHSRYDKKPMLDLKIIPSHR